MTQWTYSMTLFELIHDPGFQAFSWPNDQYFRNSNDTLNVTFFTISWPVLSISWHRLVHLMTLIQYFMTEMQHFMNNMQYIMTKMQHFMTHTCVSQFTAHIFSIISVQWISSINNNDEILFYNDSVQIESLFLQLRD